MDRRVIIAWLQDVRDLEIARHALDEAYESNLREYKKMGVRDNIPAPLEEKVRFPIVPALLAMIYLVCFFRTLNLFGLIHFVTLIMLMGVVMFGAWFLSRLHGALSAQKDNKENRRMYEERVKEDRERAAIETLAKPEVAEKIKGIANERQACSDLLDELYQENILPTQNRNIASVIYIYDYMSTSNASLDDALLHAHMEDGVQKIMAKLDYVIEQNEFIILQNRCIESNQKTLVQQNEAIFREVKKATRYAQEASEYARMADLNSKVAGFFSMATYLNDEYSRKRR